MCGYNVEEYILQQIGESGFCPLWNWRMWGTEKSKITILNNDIYV